MKNQIKITTLEEYYYCQDRGVNPLFWHSCIKLDINLRISIQNELFGHSTISKRNIVRANDKYYHYCFNHGPLCCENCGKSFFSKKNIDEAYSSVYISHILSRSNKPEMAHDPRNYNKLCFECHHKWESLQRSEMLIYFDNQIVIEELLSEY